MDHVPTEEQVAALIRVQARAHMLLSKRLWQLDRFAEAEAELDCALALVDDPAWRIKRAVMLPAVVQSKTQIEQLRQRMADRLQDLLRADLRIADPVREIDWTCYPLAYHGDVDNEPLYRLFHQTCSRACPDLDWVAPHVGRARAAGPLRVGFVSWFLNEHTISRLFLGLIEQLDPAAFAVSVFAFPGQDDAVRRCDLPGKTLVSLPLDLPAARQALAAAQLDVLVYLDLGMDPLTLFLAHARLARTQAVLWGHPDTTALSSMDFFLSSDAMEPEEGDSHYAERLVRLPGIGTWLRRPQPPPAGLAPQHFGLPSGCRFFLCPQTPQKFHPDFDPVLHRILTAQPSAHLVLTAGWQDEAMQFLRHRLLGRWPELEPRLHAIKPMHRPHFIGLLHMAEVILDPPHYSGGLTSLEAFSCGTPAVTWPGRHMRARHTYGFYRLMGIDDCIADDLDDYCDIAARLFGDDVRRLALRRRIATASQVLFEDGAALLGVQAFLMAQSGR